MKYCVGLVGRTLESLDIGGTKMKYYVGLLEILRLSGRTLESLYICRTKMNYCVSRSTGDTEAKW